METHPPKVSIAVLKTMAKKHLGKGKGSFGLYILITVSYGGKPSRIQSRNETEVMEEHGFLARSSCLLPRFVVQFAFLHHQDHLRRNGTAHSEPSLTLENTPQRCPRAI